MLTFGGGTFPDACTCRISVQSMSLGNPTCLQVDVEGKEGGEFSTLGAVDESVDLAWTAIGSHYMCSAFGLGNIWLVNTATMGAQQCLLLGMRVPETLHRKESGDTPVVTDADRCVWVIQLNMDYCLHIVYWLLWIRVWSIKDVLFYL